MQNKIIWIILLAAIFVLGFFAYKNAHTTDTKQIETISESTDELSQYVDSGNSEEFMTTSQIQEAVNKLTPQELEQFTANMAIKGPIAYQDKFYWITGTKEQNDLNDAAALAINQESNFYVIVTSKNNAKVITNDTRDMSGIEKSVNDWIEGRKQYNEIENIEYRFID